MDAILGLFRLLLVLVFHTVRWSCREVNEQRWGGFPGNDEGNAFSALLSSPLVSPCSPHAVPIVRGKCGGGVRGVKLRSAWPMRGRVLS